MIKEKVMRNIVFFHIPRTAGSSLNHMLLRNYMDAYYPCADRNGSHAAGVKTFAAMSEQEKYRYRCISGHMPMVFLDQVPWPFELVTFLRNPMDRVPSLYAFYMFIDTHPSREPWRQKGITLREWAEEYKDPEAVNGMTRRLAGGMASDREMLDRAKENLARFSFVGLQEDYTGSLVAVAHLFGIEHIHHIKRNQSPYRTTWAPSDEDLEFVRSANRLDIELYEYGRHLHKTMMVAAGPALQARVDAFLAENSSPETQS